MQARLLTRARRRAMLVAAEVRSVRGRRRMLAATLAALAAALVAALARRARGDGAGLVSLACDGIEAGMMSASAGGWTSHCACSRRAGEWGRSEHGWQVSGWVGGRGRLVHRTEERIAEQ